MKTILWIYNQPLIPEAGGTERITSLIAKGLTNAGHTCLGILVFNDKDGTMSYDGEQITDLYGFLKAHKVDIVINQIAYAKWLLEAFLANGGNRWHSEGGKIISCLHFDPCNPSVIQQLRSHENWTPRDYINLIKFTIFKQHYAANQQRSEGDTYNFIYDNSDAFVALSATHFDYLHKVMKRNEYKKLHAIGNPLTFETELSPDELAEKKNTVLVCARMSEYHKRISIILKTWKRLQKNTSANSWTLKLVGDGPDLERYRRYAADNHLQNIEFHGQCNPEPFYREAKILLLTSSAEGWGLTLTEALQYGVVPIVMNSSAVYNEIIEHRYNGYLTKGSDLKSFVNHIKALISDEHRLRSMQRNSLESAQRFTLAKTMDKWDKIIKSI